MRVESYLTDNDELLPTQALILYSGSSHTLATVHDIARDSVAERLQTLQENPDATFAPFQIGPGTLLSREVLEAMIRKLTGAPMQRSLLPASVLCQESGRLAWWVESRRRPIYFNTHNKAFNKEVGNRYVLHPALLFMAERGRLCVFALRDNVRPQADTLLARAPYYNLYDEGNMCAGSVRLPDSVALSTMAGWEDAFFSTNFTHSNLSRATGLTPHSGGHDGLWREMRDTTEETFPADYLAPTEWTVGRILNR